MQGGVRRKRDVLPRYNGKLQPRNSRNPLNYMTTPMKKILGYILLLSVAFALIKIAYADLSHTPDFELDHDALGPGKINIDVKDIKDKLGSNKVFKDADKLMKDEKAMKEKAGSVSGANAAAANAVAAANAAAGNVPGSGAAPVGSGNKIGEAANAAAAAGEANLNEKQKKVQEEIKQQQQQQAPADKNNLMKDKTNNVAENAKKQLI
ncbi:hypothetical protein RNJ44_00616 [Nakaseomyces bracarensis]|uniref:Uncharacterized protein n=1 Tax=Nakaseomyces bracarensis TaxID=273131 RepID=A0ABR4NRK8_9SACH